MPRITDDEWPRFFAEPMQRLSQEDGAPFDFWRYVDEIPKGDFNGYDCSGGSVEYVYRHPEGRLEHVLISSNDRNVFMVIVLDRATRSVVGHRLLNLRELYGLSKGGLKGSSR